MPKRVIDFEAMWASDKLAACAPWAQVEYAWLYGLADANGSFELTNLRVIWGRVAAIRENLSIERLEQIFTEFCDHGLLFVWEENGKKYGHWSNCEKTGRLPRASRRSTRYEKVFAPPVPEEAYREYLERFGGSPGSLGVAASASMAPAAHGATLGASHGDTHASLALAMATATAMDIEKKTAETQRVCRVVRPGPADVEFSAPRAAEFAYHGARLAITARQDALLGDAFPWVERQAEYRKMNSWLEANPLRRPKNASRFAHNWFSKIPPPSGGGIRVAALAQEVRTGCGPTLTTGRVKPEYLERLRLRHE